MLAASAADTTSRAGRARSIDCLRAVAAIGVLVSHADAIVAGPAPSGIIVDVLAHASTSLYLFFAVSGYLIAGPYVRALLTGERLPDTFGYAARRIARIAPAYWIALAVYILAAAPKDVSVVGVAVHLSLLHGLVPGETRALYPIAWTLGVEVLFYIAVPLVSTLLRRARRFMDVPAALRIWLILLAAGVAMAAAGLALLPSNDTQDAYGGWADVVNFGLPGCLMFFLPGILVAGAETTEAEWLAALRRRPGLTTLAATALRVLADAVAGLPLPTPLGEVFGRLILCIATGAAVAAAGGFRRSGGRAVEALAFVGTISYGVYLWHYILREALGAHGAPIRLFTGTVWGRLIVTAGFLLVTLLPAAASWFLVERPLVSRAHARARARAGTQAG